MIKSICAMILSILCTVNSYGLCVHENGYWIGEDAAKKHVFDEQLAQALGDFFVKEKAKYVADFGCGTAEYVQALLDKRIYCEGYDGNPDTPAISNGLAQVLDLSQPVELLKRYDWVLSLEVGDNIPQELENVFIENLHRHNIKGIVLSWAIRGQGGFGHFNERDNDHIKGIMAQYGYWNDVAAEKSLRERASQSWFKNSLMVFRR